MVYAAAMEAALLMLDALAIAALVFTSLKNDRLTADEPMTGPFRFTRWAAKPGGQPSRRGASASGLGGRNDATSLSATRRK